MNPLEFEPDLAASSVDMSQGNELTSDFEW